jgi:hypothetical protein
MQSGVHFAPYASHEGEAGMKLYRIVKRDSAWYVVGGDPGHSITSSDERDQLIQLARRVAARHKGELYVYDEKSKLEFVYLYTDGAECLHQPHTDPLRIAGSRSLMLPFTESL